MPIYTNDPCDDGLFPMEPSLRSSIGIGPKVTKAIDAATRDWLDKHPEATTTVEDDSLTNAKFMDGSVNSRVIEDESITTDDIADLAITTPKIANDAVTADKIASSAADGLRTMSATQPGVAKVGAGLAMNNGALELNGGSIAPAVTAWLDAHPEATTTVEDYSITTKKIVPSVLNVITNLLDVDNILDDSIWIAWGSAGYTEGVAGNNRIAAIAVSTLFTYSSTIFNSDFTWFAPTANGITDRVRVKDSSSGYVADTSSTGHLLNWSPSENGYLFITLTDAQVVGSMLVNDSTLPTSYHEFGETIYAELLAHRFDLGILVTPDRTLTIDGVAADAKVVGDAYGTGSYQYIDGEEVVRDTRYGANDIDLHEQSGYFTFVARGLPAGTYYFRNIDTDFTHMVNRNTGVRTQLASLVGGGRVSSSVTIDYSYDLYVTGNFSFDNLDYGKVLWANGPYYNLGMDRVAGPFDIKSDSRRHSDTSGRTYYVRKDGQAEYSSLKEAIEAAVIHPRSVVYVMQGEFDLIEEFGDEYFNSLSTHRMYGIMLYNDIKVVFASNTKVTCHYTGSNEYVRQDFSPFNLDKYNNKRGGFTLQNLVLECSNVRYGIHDEANGNNEPYANYYLNCSVTIDNRNNGVFSGRACIGGGLGSSGECHVVDSVFTSVTDEGTNGTGIVTYHNGGNGRSRIVIKDCVITGKDTVKASHHGSSTKVSTMTVTNCSLGSEPYLIFETSGDTIENMELISWNNEIRA